MEIQKLIKEAHETAKSKGFYDKCDEYGIIKRNIGEMLMLIVSEVGEALESHRKDMFSNKEIVRCCFEDIKCMELSDDACRPSFESCIKDTFEDEIADVFIRLFDLCGYLNIDIEKHIKLKMAYNKTRPIKHGKKY